MSKVKHLSKIDNILEKNDFYELYKENNIKI